MSNLTALAAQGHGFAVFPEVHIYDQPGGKTIQHLLFGDYITPPKTATGKYKKWTASLTRKVGADTWLRVRSRQTEGWINMDQIQQKRTLEVNFIDIGQGDGCHLVTPADEHFIIDAGEKDNMYRFLRWRFNLAKAGPALPKFRAVISHPDEDHWKGFEWLLSKPPVNQKRRIEIDTLYLNGILQRAGSKIGKTITQNGNTYLEDFLLSAAAIKAVLDLPGNKSNLEKFLIGALKAYPQLEIVTAYNTPGEENSLFETADYRMDVLAPVPDIINGQPMLRWFDASPANIGKTKNGHSIVLMAAIGKMKILLGGDLNSEAADHLMQQYSGDDIRAARIALQSATKAQRPTRQQVVNVIVNKCRNNFQAEIAKSCHHGSSDITPEFLQSVNAIATVISSGDEESFFHPRPDTLGLIGKSGRGERPLIFSTELGRSMPEFIDLKQIDKASDAKKQRIVSTYGMITVRSDGKQAIIAQKLEKNRSSFGLLTKWHIEKIIWNEEQQDFVSKA